MTKDMHQSKTDSGSILDILEQTAVKAGEIALRYFRADNKVWMKPGDSPVSEADFEVDAFLRQELLEARPDYGWLSEETADSEDRLDRKEIFVVDPIDGTRGFIAGNVHWCISIAVIRNGCPVGAVLHCPAVERTFLAAAGMGSRLNGTALEPVYGETVHSLTGSKKLNRDIASKFPEKFDIIPYGPSLAYRVAMVASGEVDGAYARSGAHEWDLAAADLVLSEAGGSVTDSSSNPIVYNTPKTRLPALVISGPGRNTTLLDLANSGQFLH
ncbi:MAG: 3'(2'),5'-bisphosphate nucleotidase CysQ [Pseudomonadota bacterium]